MRVVDLDRDMSDVIPTGTSRDAEYLFDRMARATLDALRPRPGAKLLDSAAGLGQDSRALARRGAWTVCGEPSKRMTDLGLLIEAEGKDPVGDGSVHWTRCWSESLPFATGSFDGAFCKGALDHFDDPERCIGEMARVTRSDGRVVLAIANFESLACRLQRLLDRRTRVFAYKGRRPYHVPSDHFTRYDPALVRRQLGRFVTIDQWEGISLLWGVEGWGRLLAALPEKWAHRLLRLGDTIARRFPGTSDVIIAAGSPKREGEAVAR